MHTILSKEGNLRTCFMDEMPLCSIHHIVIYNFSIGFQAQEYDKHTSIRKEGKRPTYLIDLILLWSSIPVISGNYAYRNSPQVQ